MKLKYCPHCGGEAELCGNYSKQTRSYFVFCKCTICGSQGKIYNTVEDPEGIGWSDYACQSAVKAWNMRYDEGAKE